MAFVTHVLPTIQQSIETKDTPMSPTTHDPSARIIQKVEEVQNLLTDLEKSSKKYDQKQIKIDETIKGLLRELRAQIKDPTEKGADDMKRLGLKVQTLQSSCGSLRRTADKTARALRTGTTHLGKMLELADVQALDEARELDRLHRTCGALIRALAASMTRSKLLAGVPTNTETADTELPDGAYDYIPLDLMRFLKLLIDTNDLLVLDPDFAAPGKRYRPVRFLEVGCGAGRNILLARNGNLLDLASCHGFEINSDLVATGKGAFGLDDELSVDDAMTFDYANFDVIYSYRPFHDGALQHQLERRFATTMDLGAYLLSPLGYDLSQCPELTYVGGDGQIWKKTSQI